jgi:N-acyl-L-homoserine lactone synthetase
MQKYYRCFGSQNIPCKPIIQTEQCCLVLFFVLLEHAWERGIAVLVAVIKLFMGMILLLGVRSTATVNC